jgi:tetraacyldisaccharide 4'-kinase
MIPRRPETAWHRIRCQVEKIMRDRGHTPLLSPAMLLLLLAGAYGAAVKLRASMYRQGYCKVRRLPCKVISVGNITVGGTGKTPMTRYLAREVQALGRQVAIVSRGYKGAAEKNGGLVSDGKRVLMDSATAGDEPYLLAAGLKDVPVAVGRDRFAAAMRLLQAHDPEVIILDDAFQHLPLARDLNIVLLDHQRPFGNHHLLPRGPLREPLSALARGDVFILTCRNQPTKPDGCQSVKGLPARPVLKASVQPVVAKVIPKRSGPKRLSEEAQGINAGDYLNNRQALIFSGLANNSGFAKTITQTGVTVVGALGYGDHYAYTDADLNRICAAAAAREADLIITTAKDHVRIDPHFAWPLDLVVMDVDLAFYHDRAVLAGILAKCLGPDADDLQGGSP